MNIGPEYIAAIICAFFGYAFVSAVLGMRARYKAKRQDETGSELKSALSFGSEG